MSPVAPDPEILGGTCATPDCPAAPAGPSGRCVAHLQSEELEAWLAHVAETGDLDVRGASLTKTLLQSALEAAPVGNDGRRWLGRARFDNATLEGDALFDDFSFGEEASFAGATFRGHARFGAVRFDGPAVFAGATFATHAWFMGTTFGDDASFVGAKFEGPAWFGEAVFEHGADFDGSSFASDLLAPDAQFLGGASFAGARFSRRARFEPGAFGDDEAEAFEGAVFEMPAEVPPSVKAEAKRAAAEQAPELNAAEEALPPPPTRLAPQPSRRSLVSFLPWIALVTLVVGAGVFVTRGEGTKADFVPFARGDESAFRFLLKDAVTGRPARYNPCQVLRYVVNPELGPADWRSVVREAVTEVTRGTGIKLEFEGVTNEVVRANLQAAPTEANLEDPTGFAGFYKNVFNRPSFQPDRYGPDRWAPILIGWAVLGDTPPNEKVEVLGVGASDPRTVEGVVQYVSGEAVINTNVPRSQLKRSLMHELGHVLGLAHIEDTVAIMRPNTRRGAPAWSAGDLAGLRKVGRPSGCLPAVPPGP